MLIRFLIASVCKKDALKKMKCAMQKELMQEFIMELNFKKKCCKVLFLVLFSPNSCKFYYD